MVWIGRLKQMHLLFIQLNFRFMTIDSTLLLFSSSPLVKLLVQHVKLISISRTFAVCIWTAPTSDCHISGSLSPFRTLTPNIFSHFPLTSILPYIHLFRFSLESIKQQIHHVRLFVNVLTVLLFTWKYKLGVRSDQLFSLSPVVVRYVRHSKVSIEDILDKIK